MAKTTPKKATPKATPKKKSRTMSKEPAGERRAKLVKLLKKMKATGKAPQAMKEVAKRLKYTEFDVYGLVCGTSGKAGSAATCLMAHGIAETCRMEGERGLSVYLTPKGLKLTKFDAPPFTPSPRKTATKKAAKED
jgi:hypothetical protein